MLTFFDFRNDVRKVLAEMCRIENVILFIRPEHETLIKPYLHIGFTYRIIQEDSNDTKSAMFSRLFLLFRKIPASRQNYYLMEQFKAEGAGSDKKDKALSIIKWQQRTPKWLSYDTYLNALQLSGKTDLNGITKMIALTEIYDDKLLARCIRSKIPVLVYVYSWDHACKHVRFSKQVRYAVWHEGIATDLQQLQGIAGNAIRVTGATQLGYVHQFSDKLNAAAKEKTIYFGCGVGLPSLVTEEIRVISILAVHMSQLLPDYILMVRPYPNYSDWSIYEALNEFPNIRLDNSYRQKDLSVADNDIQQKFESIARSKAFFHVGTTLGLEACFTDTPSFLLDLTENNGNAVSLYHFTHQYQNEKYLINGHPKHTITSETSLRHLLQNLDDPQLLEMNKQVQNTFHINSFTEMAQMLLSA